MSYVVDGYTINYDGGLSSSVMLRKLQGIEDEPVEPSDPEGLFITDANNDQIIKIDLTGSVLYDFVGPSVPTGIVWDGEYLRVISLGDKTISRINHLDGTVIDSFAIVADLPWGLAWDGSSLWMSDTQTSEVFELNPSDGTVLSSFTPDVGTSRGLTWDGDSIWMVDDSSDIIYNLGTTGTILSSFAAPDISLSGIVYYEGNLICSNVVFGENTDFYTMSTAGSTISSYTAASEAGHEITWKPAL